MKKKMMDFRPAFRFLVPLLLAGGMLACSKPDDFSLDPGSPSVAPSHRDYTPSVTYNKVLILYAEGHNSLSTYISDDIKDLTESYIPPSAGDALLVVSKLPLRAGRYSDPVSPVLYRLRQAADGKPVRDTLLVFPKRSSLATPEIMSEALTYIRDHFPSDHYGMIISSHASGWMPPAYYYSPAEFEGGAVSPWAARRRAGAPLPFFDDFPNDPSLPAVRSYGRDQIITGGTSQVYEMTIREVAQSIPMHLDYLFFDACLMGCVEVAYELRDVCDLIGFSQAEVLAEGLDYTKVAERLMKGETPDPVQVCQDYFEYYDAQPDGDYRSATISLVDCRKLDPLAAVCRELVAAHRDGLMQANPASVQGYFRYGRYYFFDLLDIFGHSGATEGEMASLQQALDGCVVYKAATPSFIGFDIRVFSGFSMYLPSISTFYPKKNFKYLNDFYRKEVAWNAATGLVE